MKTKFLKRAFEVDGVAYEVMLDLDGAWRGMVHVIDHGRPPHEDVLVSGARYDFHNFTINASSDDIFETDLNLVARILVAATRALVLGLTN